MAKGTNASVNTAALNIRVLAAKAERRAEKANYSIEDKLDAVQRLRDTARDLRTNAKVIKTGKVVKG